MSRISRPESTLRLKRRMTYSTVSISYDSKAFVKVNVDNKQTDKAIEQSNMPHSIIQSRA